MPKRSPKEYAREARAKTRTAGHRLTTALLTEETLIYWKDRSIESGAPLPILLGEVLTDAIFKVTVIKPYAKPTAELGVAVVEAIRTCQIPGHSHHKRLFMAEMIRRVVEFSTDERGPTFPEIAEIDSMNRTTVERHAKLLIDIGVLRVVARRTNSSRPPKTLEFCDNPVGAIRRVAATDTQAEFEMA
jgi:hypothetical protein